MLVHVQLSHSLHCFVFVVLSVCFGHTQVCVQNFVKLYLFHSHSIQFFSHSLGLTLSLFLIFFKLLAKYSVFDALHTLQNLMWDEAHLNQI